MLGVDAWQVLQGMLQRDWKLMGVKVLIRNVESKDCKVMLVMFTMGMNKFKMVISVTVGKVVFAVMIKLELLIVHKTGDPIAKHEILPRLLN